MKGGFLLLLCAALAASGCELRADPEGRTVELTTRTERLTDQDRAELDRLLEILDKGKAPSRGIRPAVGFNPTSPHQAAGIRQDPPVSVPSAPCAIPSLTETAPPEVEPPEICPASRRQGLSGVP